jgi:hypothetical protein
MSFLVLSRGSIEETIRQNNGMSSIAKALRPDIWQLIGKDGEPIYQIHELSNERLHIERKSDDCLPLREITCCIEEKIRVYKDEVAPLIERLKESLESDMNHTLGGDNKPVYNLSSLINCGYYTEGLSKLNGHRREAVGVLNMILSSNKIPGEFWFPYEDQKKEFIDDIEKLYSAASGNIGPINGCSFTEAEKKTAVLAHRNKIKNPVIVIDLRYKPNIGAEIPVVIDNEPVFNNFLGIADICESVPNLYVIDGDRYRAE